MLVHGNSGLDDKGHIQVQLEYTGVHLHTTFLAPHSLQRMLGASAEERVEPPHSAVWRSARAALFLMILEQKKPAIAAKVHHLPEPLRP